MRGEGKEMLDNEGVRTCRSENVVAWPLVLRAPS